MKRLFSLALALAVASSVALGADYYDGLSAYKAGDYEKAVEEWTPLAQAGFPEAQYQLARMYHRGYAVQDDAEAARLYRLAAEQDHVMAQNNLGVMYEQGRGVERDEAEAAKWYQKAAQEGLTVAQANLARLYEEGRGVDADPQQAARLYGQAGDAGHLTSQYRLARLYEQGRGVDQNDRKAASWYRKAAKHGHAEAQLALARMYESGRGVKRDPSKAAKWRRLATMQGLEMPAPEGASPGPEEARSEPEPEEAQPEAVSEKARPEPEPEEAQPEPEPEKAQPEPQATGPAQETVDVTGPADVAPPAPLPPPPEVELAPALAAAFDAAEAGDVDAQYDLARRFETGDGLPVSHKEAVKWYEAAASRDHGFAGYKLAFHYFRGKGTAHGKDLVEAHFWFSVSAQRGIGDAEQWRERLEKKMSKRQIEESRKKLAEWNRR